MQLIAKHVQISSKVEKVKDIHTARQDSSKRNGKLIETRLEMNNLLNDRSRTGETREVCPRGVPPSQRISTSNKE